MEDFLVLTIVIKGGNIMGNPLLRATGVAQVNDDVELIEKETPITSIPNFVAAFKGLFPNGEQ